MPDDKKFLIRLPAPLAKRVEAWRKAREREEPGLRLSRNAALILLLEKSLPSR